MKEQLDISGDLALPLDWVTQRGALLAVSGAGKSNAARAIAEEFFQAELPFVAIDPKGDWWGLRAGRDGKPEGGIDIVIFGGKHGDVPLEREGGKFIADLVVDQRLSCILDLSGFESEADKKKFLLDFATRLYRRNENPLHLFLDEADDYVPQRPMKDELRLLRAFENIVRRGRQKGIGVTLISQRSALLNKNVLTQVETLFAMRTTGPQDLAAVLAWMKHHGADEKMLSTMATLDAGEAWAWSPHYLGKMERIRFRLSHTYDSGATPKNHRRQDALPPATLSDVDVSLLRDQMRDTIERAEAEDPVLLHRRIAELEKELRQAQRQQAASSKQRASDPAKSQEPRASDLRPWREWVGQLRAEVDFEKHRGDAALRRVEELETHVNQLYIGIEHLGRWTAQRPKPWTPPRMTAAELSAAAVSKTPGEPAEKRLNGAASHATVLEPKPLPAFVPSAAVVATQAVIEAPEVEAGSPGKERSPSPEPSASDYGLGKGGRSVLGALRDLGVLPQWKLAIVTGYRNGKAFRNLLSELRTKGLLDSVAPETVGLTPAGEARAEGLPGPMGGEELAVYWESKLGKTARLSFRYLLEHGDDIAMDELAVETGYKPGKAFRNAMSELRGWGLAAPGQRGRVSLGEARECFT
jgi:hypothetical protein